MIPNSPATPVRLTQDERRRKVAALYARQITQVEIAKELGISQTTVSRDIEAARALWRGAANEEIEAHVARQLSELSEVKRAAWNEKDLKAVLAALAAERDLLGLSAPKQIDLRVMLERYIEEAEKLPDADLLRRLGYAEPAPSIPGG